MRESAPSAAASSTQALVASEQLRAHYAQIPVMALAPTLGGLFSSWVLWDAVDNRWLVVGMAAVATLSALRLLLWRHYFQLPPEQAVQRRWRVIAVLAAGVSGCIWGSAAPFLYPPLRPEYQVFLIVLLTMLPIVPVAALAAYLPTLYAYYLPCIAPFAVVLSLQPSRSEQMAAVLLLMMMGAMHTFASRYSRSLAESIALRLRLDERSQALQQAVRDKSQFIASASHDLRQPVQAMGLFLEAMRQPGGELHDEQAFEHLDNSLKSLRGMLTNMLDISRLDARGVEPQPQHFALDGLLRRLGEEHAPLAVQRGLRWRVRSGPAVALSDPALLERILRNLLSNALKYTHTGGVLLACRSQGGALRVQVVDTGVGIAEADRHVVFDEFTRLADHRSGSDAGGLGLGLAIVRRMSDLLGHPVTLRSRPGHGSVFTVTLPRGRADALLLPVARPPAPSPMLAAPGWVLVIDNDPAVGAASAALLRRWGHRASVCGSAAEALALLSDGAAVPQLLLVDCWLAGGGSGLAAAAGICRHLGQPVPVIMITGDTARERIREAYEAGHVLLHKPVDPQLLRSCVAEACAQVPRR